MGRKGVHALDSSTGLEGQRQVPGALLHLATQLPAAQCYCSCRSVLCKLWQQALPSCVWDLTEIISVSKQIEEGIVPDSLEKSV
jgi:hypothetical protein